MLKQGILLPIEGGLLHYDTERTPANPSTNPIRPPA